MRFLTPPRLAKEEHSQLLSSESILPPYKDFLCLQEKSVESLMYTGIPSVSLAVTRLPQQNWLQTQSLQLLSPTTTHLPAISIQKETMSHLLLA